MNEITAIEIAKSKMRELNVEDYILRYRNLRLESQERRTISAENEFYIVIQRNPVIEIKSKAGIYDLQDVALREIQHVHTGKIEIVNKVAQTFTVALLQVIPKQKKATK